ncbi:MULTISPECIES: RnfABCDGE type electron transport complex subunit B [unclassified Francisella]|uniref:RnfABCDGE type electron transport complex subunit B n=1 Tax=unclassified Francisella TaxID=2610885 RepID=UPI002E2FCEFF|nr:MULTISPECIES: RnfABCDGE type electron transport complex subunit B [unclassified Francisella]MED7818985.1 RnfABCDGE type electron transport complex subunit B [Francisella sp. 19S2-4]MED7829858.1 RnfABCDGE type electron transport complex subunit B [Francisella sp. 19S2-10]
MIISVDSIDKVLPQTQCQKCTYEDCYSYAKAITNGEKHNKCITGGQKTLKELSKLLNKPEIPLDISLGQEKPRAIAKIDESMCIGCMKCILACPVDAISGTKKLMHTVIESECTGCELCIEPCPMDCISLVDITEERQPVNLSDDEYETQKDYYRDRYEFHKQRVEQSKSKQRDVYKNIATAQEMDKKAYIAASLTKFRNKKKKPSINE